MKALFTASQRRALHEARHGTVNIEKMKADIMANDPATYGDYGEYEFHGTLKDRVCEIIYNHAYEAASPYGGKDEVKMRQSLEPLFVLAKKERFTAAAEKSWREGLEDGGS